MTKETRKPRQVVFNTERKDELGVFKQIESFLEENKDESFSGKTKELWAEYLRVEYTKKTRSRIIPDCELVK